MRSTARHARRPAATQDAMGSFHHVFTDSSFWRQARSLRLSACRREYKQRKALVVGSKLAKLLWDLGAGAEEAARRGSPVAGLVAGRRRAKFFGALPLFLPLLVPTPGTRIVVPFPPTLPQSCNTLVWKCSPTLGIMDHFCSCLCSRQRGRAAVLGSGSPR